MSLFSTKKRERRLQTIGRLFLLFTLVEACFALPTGKKIHQFLETVWSTRDGLPTQAILDLAQDEKGYIWIGTYNGLIRFDGVQFQHFNRYNTKGFESSSARSLLVDRRGRLLIGTNGDGLIVKEGRTFVTYSESSGLPNQPVLSLCEDLQGTIWIGTTQGLYRFNEGNFEFIKSGQDRLNHSTQFIYRDHQNTIWVGCADEGIFRIANDMFERDPRFEYLNDVTVRCMLEDSLGNIWVGTENHGFYRVKGDSYDQGGVDPSFLTSTVICLLEDENKTIWLGTTSGLLRYQNGKYDLYNEDEGLVNNSINDILEDKEGNLWIATYRGGLAKLSDGKFLTLSVREGITHNTVNTICETRNQDVWIGTDAGVSVFKDFKVIDHPITELVGPTRIRHISQARDGTVWLSSLKGLMAYKNQKLRTITAEDGLTNNLVRVAIEDFEGTIWAGTQHGLNKYKNGEITTFTNPKDLDNDLILGLFEDSSNRMWVTTAGGGVYLFDHGNKIALSMKDGINSDTVFKVFEDSRGILWLATTEGVCRFIDGHFYPSKLKFGHYENQVFDILEDAHHGLWFVCSHDIFGSGLSIWPEKEDPPNGLEDFAYFDVSDGLRSDVSPVSWSLMSQSGEIWFATLDGVAILDTDDIRYNDTVPPVYIETINIDGENLYSNGNPITLEPGSKRIVINFSALSMVCPEEVKFQYKLEGFEDNWSDPDKERMASYTSLRPDTYTFRVRASNNDGRWNKEGASLTIVQKPYFTQTPAFYFLAGSILLIIILGIYAIRTHELKIRQRDLEALVSQRTGELKLANAHLESLSQMDSLTQLGNRRALDKMLELEWKRHTRSNVPLSLILCDIDFFKNYNDFYGHQAGDACLIEVGRTLASCARRPTDFAFRYGGEEFLLLLPQTDRGGALAIAQSILDSFQALKLEHKYSEVSPFLTISCGVSTTLPAQDFDPSELIETADKALYLSKQNGRNRYTFKALGPEEGTRAEGENQES